jgi:hypothetical protein
VERGHCCSGWMVGRRPRSGVVANGDFGILLPVTAIRARDPTWPVVLRRSHELARAKELTQTRQSRRSGSTRRGHRLHDPRPAPGRTHRVRALLVLSPLCPSSPRPCGCRTESRRAARVSRRVSAAGCSLSSFIERNGNLRQIPSDNPEVVDCGSRTK